MPRILINTKDMPREKWLEYRKNSIGGSEASAVLGLNSFKSRYTLWAEKKGFINISDSADNEAMRIGRDLEEYVAERFCEVTRKRVRRKNFMFLHNDYDFISANIDREIIGENAGLECKTTNIFNKSDFENGEIPLYYYCQCMHYMAVMGYKKMYLAVLVLSRAFYWFEIERNDEEIQNLIKSEVDFWNRFVVNEEVPEVDGSENTDKTILCMYNREEEEKVALKNDDIKEYMELQNRIKELQVLQNELKQKIQVTLGNCDKGFSKDFEVTWKKQIKNIVDTKRLKQEEPEIYNKFLKVSQNRVFKVKETGGNLK